MKNILIILMVFVLQFQYISQLAVLMGFVLNQKMIAKVWCEKKSETNNTCNGKCYLKKQLKKTESTENSEQKKLPQYKFKFDFDYNIEIEDNISFLIYTFRRDFLINNQTHLSKGYLQAIIKPPSV